MLALSLEKISSANNPDTDIRIFADTDTNMPELAYVRDNYAPEALIFRALPHPPALSGTWNILHALNHAARFATEKVFLIEEDVLVGKHFFDSHRANLTYELFATCGRHHRPDYEKYTNPGSAFHAQSVQMLAEHINNEFFANTKTYLDENFPGTQDDSPHDDGLIRRMIAYHKLQIKIADKPICAHIGFHAYNHYSGYDNRDGSIEHRIAWLREMLPKISRSDRYTRDFETMV